MGALFGAVSSNATDVLVTPSAAIPAGSVPKPSTTLSPSSADSSSTAVTVAVLVSAPPLSKVTSDGASKSPAAAPPADVAVSGTVTASPGSRLSRTVTAADAPPSTAL